MWKSPNCFIRKSFREPKLPPQSTLQHPSGPLQRQSALRCSSQFPAAPGNIHEYPQVLASTRKPKPPIPPARFTPQQEASSPAVQQSTQFQRCLSRQYCPSSILEKPQLQHRPGQPIRPRTGSPHIKKLHPPPANNQRKLTGPLTVSTVPDPFRENRTIATRRPNS